MEDNINQSCEELHLILLKCIDDLCQDYNDEIAKDVLKNVWPQLYKKSSEENYWWEFCPFSVWEKKIEQWNTEFFEVHPDAEQMDFYISIGNKHRANFEIDIFEYEGNDDPFKFLIWPEKQIIDHWYTEKYPGYYNLLLSDYLHPTDFWNSYYSEKKKFQKLTEKLQEGQNISNEKTAPNLTDESLSSKIKLVWNGAKVDLAELLIALHESKLIIGYKTKEELFELFSEFLSTPLDATIDTQSLTKRIENKGEMTKFLDTLRVFLTRWNDRRIEKKEMNK